MYSQTRANSEKLHEFINIFFDRNARPAENKKPCQIFLLDRDKTKNKHYEQTLFLS